MGLKTTEWTLTAIWSLTYVHVRLHKSFACLLASRPSLATSCLKLLPRFAPFTPWSVFPRCTSQRGNSMSYFCCFVMHARARCTTVFVNVFFNDKFRILLSCDGREVKALDSKSNGVSPRRFEPCSQRFSALGEILVLPLIRKMAISMKYYKPNFKHLSHSCVGATTLAYRKQTG